MKDGIALDGFHLSLGQAVCRHDGINCVLVPGPPDRCMKQWTEAITIKRHSWVGHNYLGYN